MKRSLAAWSTLLLVAVGCSSHTGTNSGSASATDTTNRTKSTGHVGDTLKLTRSDGTRVDVTLTEIINPATVSNGPAEAGMTYLATKLMITDRASEAIDGAVNVNVSVLGSDNQNYSADLRNDVAECTNFESGLYHLSPGESATGCVVFALPNGVTPAKVLYTPSEGFADDSGEWLIS